MGDGVLRIGAWKEVLGVVEELAEGKLTIKASRFIMVDLTEEELKKFGRLLRRGCHVGLVVLGDGSLRVRSLIEPDQR